jgi:50S ribosomal protein L10 (fragment)
MRSDWKKTTIDEVCSRIYSGGTPSTKEPKYWNGDINWLSSGETRNKFIYGTERKITRLGVEESSTQLALKDSVVIATAGQGYTRGQASFLKIDTYVNQSVLVFEADTQVIEPLFLYYNLSNRYEELRQLSDGTSTRGGLSGWIVKRMDIDLPSLSLQKKIVDILYDIDQKIECNTAINKNLEEQAQAIFYKYFIYISDVPTNWQEANLTNIAEYRNGLAMQKFRPQKEEKSLPVLKIKELRQGHCDLNSERCSLKIKPEYIIHDSDVIFSWSGSLLVDFWCGGTCGLNQHLFKVYSKEYEPWLYYSWTKYHLTKFISMAADRATTMGHIKRDALEQARVLIPCHDDYLEIGRLLQPLYDSMISNRVEIRKLSKLRDTLLPRLMSGELDVSNIEL